MISTHLGGKIRNPREKAVSQIGFSASAGKDFEFRAKPRSFIFSNLESSFVDDIVAFLRSDSESAREGGI